MRIFSKGIINKDVIADAWTDHDINKFVQACEIIGTQWLDDLVKLEEEKVTSFLNEYCQKFDGVTIDKHTHQANGFPVYFLQFY